MTDSRGRGAVRTGLNKLAAHLHRRRPSAVDDKPSLLANAVIAGVLTLVCALAVSEVAARITTLDNLRRNLVDNAEKLRAQPVTATAQGSSDLRTRIEQSNTYIQEQIVNLSALNAFGARSDRCAVLASLASGRNGFEAACRDYAVLPNDPSSEQSLRDTWGKDKKGDWIAYLPRIKELVHGDWSSRIFQVLIEERSVEHLFFLIVVLCAGVGSLVVGLRTAGCTTHRDLALGLVAGFAAYLFLRGGKYVFTVHGIDEAAANPFSVALVAFIVGLYTDKAYAALDKLVGDRLRTGSAVDKPTSEPSGNMAAGAPAAKEPG